MEDRKLLVVEESKEESKQTVMCWNETCSNCYYFEGGDSTCRRSGATVESDHPKCGYFSSY